MNANSPQPGKPAPKIQKTERRDSWIVILVKIVFFLALGTLVLAALFFGTCLLLMKR